MKEEQYTQLTIDDYIKNRIEVLELRLNLVKDERILKETIEELESLKKI